MNKMRTQILQNKDREQLFLGFKEYLNKDIVVVSTSTFFDPIDEMYKAIIHYYL